MKSIVITIPFALLSLIQTSVNAQTPTAPPSNTEIQSELKIIDKNIGTGAEAIAGSTVVVHYTGWLFDSKDADQHGKKFDTSLSADRGPFSFQIGVSRVIKGWQQGLVGMKVGGKRTLIIPPELGYGARGAGDVIPPNASLVFDIELLEVK